MEWLLPILLVQVVTVTPALEQWLEDIVRLDGSRIIVLEVPAEPGARSLPLPENPRQRAMLAPYFGSADFVAQFAAAQATCITHSIDSGRISFVLLNTRQLSGDEGEREAVVAHEFGHLWIKASRYPTAVYQGGAAACLYINAGDVVQHPLIRREMTRRGIRWVEPWVRSLDAALKRMESEPAAAGQGTRCQNITRVSLFVDVALNLTTEQWPDAPRFLAGMRKSFPAAAAVAEELAAHLRAVDLADRQAHRVALQYSFDKLKALALSLPE